MDHYYLNNPEVTSYTCEVGALIYKIRTYHVSLRRLGMTDICDSEEGGAYIKKED
jgi:hypothetical protein